jgi:hypothetical protein
VIAAGSRGPAVVDTDVFSADLVPGSWLAERYAPIITGQPAFVSFQTAAELRYGALSRGWGPGGSARAAKRTGSSSEREIVGRRPAAGERLRGVLLPVCRGPERDGPGALHGARLMPVSFGGALYSG